MEKEICSSCHLEGETVVESGEFDADGPGGTIRGNTGDLVVSACCGEPVIKIDAELHDWCLELRALAKSKGCDWVADDPKAHKDLFKDGLSVEEALDECGL